METKPIFLLYHNYSNLDDKIVFEFFLLFFQSSVEWGSPSFIFSSSPRPPILPSAVKDCASVLMRVSTTDDEIELTWIRKIEESDVEWCCRAKKKKSVKILNLLLQFKYLL